MTTTATTQQPPNHPAMAEFQMDPTIEAVFGPPPPGINLQDDNCMVYNIVACVFFVLAVISVMLRVYVRMTRGAKLALDDHTIVGAIVSRHFGEREKKDLKGSV